MASGKTTLGRALGARPGYRFIDLDEEVENEVGMKVADIFAMRGENTSAASRAVYCGVWPVKRKKRWIPLL